MDSIVVNETTHQIMSPQDFVELVYSVMGWDAGHYLEQLLADYDWQIEDLTVALQEYENEDD